MTYLPGTVASVLALGAILIADRFEPWSSEIQAIASAMLGVGVAVLYVNSFLHSKDRRNASQPLLKMINDQVAEYHNECFIRAGRDAFGKAQWEALITKYQDHKRNPEVFSPEEREKLLRLIAGKRKRIEQIFGALEPQLRELVQIVGWSFDPKIVGVALNARLYMQQFLLADEGKSEDQLSIIEAYFDVDGTVGTVIQLLAKRLGTSVIDENRQ